MVNVDEVDVAVVIVSAGVKFGVSASSVQGLGFRVCAKFPSTPPRFVELAIGSIVAPFWD